MLRVTHFTAEERVDTYNVILALLSGTFNGNIIVWYRDEGFQMGFFSYITHLCWCSVFYTILSQGTSNMTTKTDSVMWPITYSEYHNMNPDIDV